MPSASCLRRTIKFLLVLATTLLGLLAVTFFIGRVVPIDPVLAIVGDRAPRSASIERARQELGLDRPLIEQFVIYVKKAADRRFRQFGADHQSGDDGHPRAFPGDDRTRDAGHAASAPSSACRSAFSLRSSAAA